MNDLDPVAMTQAIAAIRLRLASQRQALVARCNPGPIRTGAFPRSQTMRILAGEPGLATGLVAGAAAMFVARRLFQSGSLFPLLAGVIGIMGRGTR